MADEMTEGTAFDDMPDEIDFSQSVPNPYTGRMRRRVTLNIDCGTVDYFKEEASRTGVPYQTIMNMCLGTYAKEQRHLTFS